MKKTIQLILGIGVLLLFIASISLAQAYYVAVPGVSFCKATIDGINGYAYCTTHPVRKTCPVVFPDHLKYIEKMSFDYYDNTAIGELKVDLVKKNRWTGITQIIASRSTGIANAANEMRWTGVILGSGRGISNKHYDYYLLVYFNNPNNDDLRLYSVTFTCQPH